MAIFKTSGKHSAIGKKKGGIRKNTMLDGITLMPILIPFNAAADNDEQFPQFIKLAEGSFFTFDKGYNNYQQLATFRANRICFITRQKDNAVYKTVSEKILTATTPNEVLKEKTIEQNYKDSFRKTKVLQLCRIAWWNPKGNCVCEFITNNFELDA